MALKDLVAAKSALDEAAIEELVQDYVRYDPGEREIVFLPEFSTLSSKQKILVYLVALQGWSFVVEEAVETETKPANLEEKLGIPGGSLRPMLKDLKDRHLVMSKGAGYSLRASSLAAVKKEMSVGSGGVPAAVRRRRSSGNTRAGGNPVETGEAITPNEPPKKKKSSSGTDVKGKFASWIAGGFFKKPRTLAEVQKQFHQEAVIIPRTSIPKYLLGAIRDGSLVRSKQAVDGKTVWVYSEKA
jgi:hypothetical protein